MGYRILFFLLILLAIFIITGCDLSNLKGEEQQIEITNKAAFDFQLKDLKGNPIKLSDYKNQKVVLLVFGATWCLPCQTELPEVQEYYQSADKEQVEIIWIYNDEKENTIKNFRDKYNLEFPIVNDQDGAVYDQYKISSIPTTVFIDKQGEISEIKIGPLDRENLAKKITELIEI